MAKNKVRKPRAKEYVGTGRRLSQNPYVVVVAVLVCAGLLLSTMVLAGSGLFSGGNTTNQAGTGTDQQALIKQYKDILSKNPNDIRTRENLGTTYFEIATTTSDPNQQAANLRLAIAEFEKVTAKEPFNAPTLGDLATAYYYTGQADKAIVTARQALKADSKLYRARINLGIYLSSKQKYSEAIAELEKIPAAAAESGEAKSLISQFRQQQKQTGTKPGQGTTTTPGTSAPKAP